MATKPATDRIRNAQLGLIHQAKAALALDDDTYRTVLNAQCNVTSAADLDKAGRDKVLDYLRTKGWQPPARPAPTRRRDPAPPANKVGLWKKIDKLLSLLGVDRSYLNGNIKKRIAGGISAWAFADEQILLKVIAALQIAVNRKEKKEQGNVRG